MSKKKQDVQAELDKILQPESELEPSGSGIVESLNNIDQVIQEFESEKPQPETSDLVEMKKKLMLRVHVGKAKIVVYSLTAIQEEYQRVRAGHLPNNEVFFNCLQNLADIANTLMLKELEADGITMEELQEALMNYGKPEPPTHPIISSMEPPEVVPVSPSPSEEPLKDPSPTDPQPSNE